MNARHLSQVGRAKICSLFLDLNLKKQLRVLHSTVVLSRIRPAISLGQQFEWCEEQKQQRYLTVEHRPPPVHVKK
jgi:hypothetical protein